MDFHEFLQLASRKRRIIYGFIAVFLVVATFIVAVQRFKYSAKSQLLVVQEHDKTVDAYTVSKSNEYLSSILAQVITSNSFYTKVLESGLGVDKDYFGSNTKDQMKNWEQTINARSVGDSGIIAVTVYHPDRAQSEKIIRAVDYVLMTQHAAYHGSGDSIKIRLIDQPVTSSFPVEPNIPLIGGLALALGFVSSLIYIYLLPQNHSKQASQRLSFEDVMSANAPMNLPDYRRPPRLRDEQPRYADVQIRGQLPEDAIDNLSSAHEHMPRQATSPYGRHERVPLEYFDEGPVLGPADIDPQRLVRQGNMKNILG